jgi:hypothetical protein
VNDDRIRLNFFAIFDILTAVLLLFPSLLGCDIMSLGEWSFTFQWIVMLSSSRLCGLFFDCLTLNMKALWSFKMSGTTCPVI